MGPAHSSELGRADRGNDNGVDYHTCDIQRLAVHRVGVRTGKSMLLALCLPIAAFAAWTVWRCVGIPHRKRIIATREGDCLMVKHTSDNRSAIRLDLRRVRYAWLKRQIGWRVQFGSTPTVAHAPGVFEVSASVGFKSGAYEPLAFIGEGRSVSCQI